MNNKMIARRGEVYIADSRESIGSEQGGTRPVVIIQNDIGNRFSNTVIVASATSKTKPKGLPMHVLIKDDVGLSKLDHTTILLEQIETIDKRRLHEKIGILSALDMHRVDKALKVSLGLE